MRKVRYQQIIDNVAISFGANLFIIAFYVSAFFYGCLWLERSGRTADAVVFHNFNQSGIRVAGGRFGKMLFRFQFGAV